MTQWEALQLWWLHLDEFTRHRVLALRPDEALPEDLAAMLQLHGITVTDLGTFVADDGEHVRVWAQPEVLLDLVERETD